MGLNVAWRRVALVMLVVLAYGSFAAQKVIRAGGDFSVFVTAGDWFFDRPALDVPIIVQPHSYGYDGQFVYRLALDPLTAKRTDHGITIDTPSLRAQRIGYPLLAHLASLGSPRLVPLALVLLNIAGIALLAWVSTGVALLFGRPAWQGLIVPLYPGLILSLSHDTTEIVSTAFAVSAVYLALRGRTWGAGLVACAAVLTRETTLLYLAGFGIVVAMRAVTSRRGDWRILAFLLPVLTLVGWQMVLIRTWGTTSFSDVGSHDLGLPPLRYLVLAAIGDVNSLRETGFRLNPIYFLVTKAFVVAQAAIVGTALARRPIDWRLASAWLLYLALATLFTDAIWVEPYGYLRILADLYTTGSLVLLAGTGDRGVKLVWAMTGSMWIIGCGFA